MCDLIFRYLCICTVHQQMMPLVHLWVGVFSSIFENSFIYIRWTSSVLDRKLWDLLPSLVYVKIPYLILWWVCNRCTSANKLRHITHAAVQIVCATQCYQLISWSSCIVTFKLHVRSQVVDQSLKLIAANFESAMDQRHCINCEYTNMTKLPHNILCVILFSNTSFHCPLQ